MIWPSWWNNLPEAKQREFPGYAGSCIHHYVVSPFCTYSIVKDFLEFNSTGITFPSNHLDFFFTCTGLMPFVLGYFLADTIVNILPDALKGNPLYLAHHGVSAFTIVTLLTSAVGSTTQIFPLMMACELSSVFFNTAWCMRAMGMKGNPVVKAFELLFVITFFLTRNVNLVTAYCALFSRMGELGYAHYTIIFAMCLQYYWLFKIYKSLTKKAKKTDADKE